jgi:hypothetical protein
MVLQHLKVREVVCQRAVMMSIGGSANRDRTRQREICRAEHEEVDD